MLLCEIAVAEKLKHILENVRAGVSFDSVMWQCSFKTICSKEQSLSKFPGFG